MSLSSEERKLMLIITGFTNFACFPSLYVLYKKGLYFQFHVGIFTFLTSLMYHSLESVDWKSLYLDIGTWHKLDNIGSITCFIMLCVYWMDNIQVKNGNYYSKHVVPADLHLNMIGLFVTMLVQANHPWKLENTVIPIVLYFTALILKVSFGRKPRFNAYFLKRGAGMLLIAIFFFIRGLDENQDYLRINHGMWHCLAGTSSFFIWQSIDKDKPIEAENVKYSNQNRYTYWYVIQRMLTLKVFSEDTINVHKSS